MGSSKASCVTINMVCSPPLTIVGHHSPTFVNEIRGSVERQLNHIVIGTITVRSYDVLCSIIFVEIVSDSIKNEILSDLFIYFPASVRI